MGGFEGHSVGVVLLNWNGALDTLQCLSSLAAASGDEMSLVPIVVDNGSDAADRAALEAGLDESVELIRNPENRGFARASNQGIRRLLERKVDYIALLNNDAVLHPQALARAVAGLRTGRFDIVSGRILEDDRHVSYAGGHLNRWLGRAVVPAEGKPDGPAYAVSGPTRFVTCAYSVAPAATYERHGLLPEDYFFGTEEWDFSMRLRRQGARLGYIADSVCTHRGAGTHSLSRPRYVYSGYRNKLIFQQRYLPRALWPIWRAVFGLYVGTLLPRLHERRHAGSPAAGTLRLCARRALADHSLGRPVELAELMAVEAEALAAHIAVSELGDSAADL